MFYLVYLVLTIRPPRQGFHILNFFVWCMYAPTHIYLDIIEVSEGPYFPA